jgi:hypothetical protein
MVVYSLRVPYVTLSASNEPDSGLEGKGAGDRWHPLMSLAVVGVNQFKLLLLCSGVHSESRVFDPLQCFLLLFFVCLRIVSVNESIHVWSRHHHKGPSESR